MEKLPDSLKKHNAPGSGARHFGDEDLPITRQIPEDPGFDIHAGQMHEANHSSCL